MPERAREGDLDPRGPARRQVAAPTRGDSGPADALAGPVVSPARLLRRQHLAGNRSVARLLAAERPRGARVQREYKATDFASGSAGANQALAAFKKNQYWEIGFRKYSKVGPGEFDVDRENDAIVPLQSVTVREGIPINHSIEGIAVSRNADFVLDVLRAGSKKVVAVIAIPPDFGIDLESEYLKHYRKDKEANPTGRSFPQEYEDNTASKLSMEVTLQRVPAGCVYGWIERNVDVATRETTLTWVTNPKRACKNIEEVDDQERYAELISKVRAIEGVKLVGFP